MRVYARQLDIKDMLNSGLLAICALLLTGCVTGGPVKQADCKATLNLVTEQRILADRIADTALRYARGAVSNAEDLHEMQTVFEANLHDLQQGNPDKGIMPAPDALATEIHAVARQWERDKAGLEKIQQHHQRVAMWYENANAAKSYAAAMIPQLDDVVRETVSAKASKTQISIANKQLSVARRLSAYLTTAMNDSGDLVQAIDRVGRDTTLLGNVLDGQLAGHHDMGIEKVRNAGLRTRLQAIGDVRVKLDVAVLGFLEDAPKVFEIRLAVADIVKGRDALDDRLEHLESSYRQAYSGCGK